MSNMSHDDVDSLLSQLMFDQGAEHYDLDHAEGIEGFYQPTDYNYDFEPLYDVHQKPQDYYQQLFGMKEGETQYDDFNPVMDVLKQLADENDNMDFGLQKEQQHVNQMPQQQMPQQQVQQVPIQSNNNMQQQPVGDKTDIMSFFNVQSQPPLQQNTYPKPASPPSMPEPFPQQQSSNSQQTNDSNSNNNQTKRPEFTKWRLPLPYKQYSFMGKGDIGAVLKSQLYQLSCVDPAKDDFYCQVYRTRAMNQANKKEQVKTGPGKSMPTTARIATVFQNADGTPKLPPGTLGKVTYTNLRKPRTALDFADMDTNVSNNIDRATNMFSKYSLLYLIEEGLRVIMSLEDIDSFVVALQNKFNKMGNATPDMNYERDRLMHQRAELIYQLAECLDLTDQQANISYDHILLQFAGLKKGRLLIFRSLLLMGQSSPHIYKIVPLLLLKMELFLPGLVSKYDVKDDKLAHLVCDLLYNMHMDPLLYCFFTFVNSIKSNVEGYTMIQLAKCRMGCVLLQVFTKKAHQIMIAIDNPNFPSNINPRIHLEQWRHSFQLVFELVKDNIPDLFKNLPRFYPKKHNHNHHHHKNSKKEHKDGQIEVTLVQSMWELVASFVAHLTPEQITPFADSLRPIFQTEMAWRTGREKQKSNLSQQQTKETAPVVQSIWTKKATEARTAKDVAREKENTNQAIPVAVTSYSSKSPSMLKLQAIIGPLL